MKSVMVSIPVEIHGASSAACTSLPGRGGGQALLLALTHKALCLAVPERGSTHPIGHQCQKGFLDLLAECRVVQRTPKPASSLPIPIHPPGYHLQGNVKDNELAAGRDGIVTAVAPQEVHIDLSIRVLKLRLWAQPQYLISQGEGDRSPVFFLLLFLLPGAYSLWKPCRQNHPRPS